MDLYIVAAVVAVLLVAQVLCWMQPRRKAGKASPDTTITVEVTLNGADDVSAQLDGLTAKAAHLADMLARAKRDAGLIALPVHDTAKQYPSTKVGDLVTYHVAGEKLPRKISTKAPQRAPAKKTRTR